MATKKKAKGKKQLTAAQNKQVARAMAAFQSKEKKAGRKLTRVQINKALVRMQNTQLRKGGAKVNK